MTPSRFGARAVKYGRAWWSWTAGALFVGDSGRNRYWLELTAAAYNLVRMARLQTAPL